MLYFVKCRVTSSGKEVALLSQTTGLRRLGVRKHSLWLDGHRFVLRGVTCGNRNNTPAEQQSAAPEGHRTADVLDLPAEIFSKTNSLELEMDENLKTADEIGRPLIIRLHPKSRPSAIPSIICRLTSHPSVFLTVIPDTLLPEVPNFSAYKGTMLFATEMSAQNAPLELPKGIDLAIVRFSQSVPDSSWKTPPPYPVIAWQTAVAFKAAGMRSPSSVARQLENGSKKPTVILGLGWVSCWRRNDSSPGLKSASNAKRKINFDELRFIRQIRYQKLGADGQQKLSQAHVGIVGCGALGSATAVALTRAGIGNLTIIDRDVPEWSNLPRQLLYTEKDVHDGLPKAIIAERRLKEIDRNLHVISHVADLTAHNISDLLSAVDIIVDGTDNFETRFLMNDFSCHENIPWIYGGVIGAEGRVMTVIPWQNCMLAMSHSRPSSSWQSSNM